jgi:hypothetical protein
MILEGNDKEKKRRKHEASDQLALNALLIDQMARK